MTWPPADSPFWSWSKSIVVIIAVAVVLAMNASSFDSTEMKAIIEIAAVIAGLTGLHNAVKAKSKEPTE